MNWFRGKFVLISLLTLVISVWSLAQDAQSSSHDIPLYHVGNRAKGWAMGQTGPDAKDNFLDKVQPVLTTRCVACHGCYEAPCQLNLQSYDGVVRGYNPIPIFSSSRVDYTVPTRMEDPPKGFLPILSNKATFDKSLLFRFLDQANKNNSEGMLQTDELAKIQTDYIENDKRSCIATRDQFVDHFNRENKYNVITFEDFVAKSRFVGMPYGLTRLQDSDHAKLVSWLQTGALGPTLNSQRLLETPTNPAPIIDWENFFNQNSAQSRQTSRYIFEHAFSALIHFDENPGEYFDLVRSKTKTGPIVRIVTELPTQDPKGPVYYRFKKVTRAIAQKTTNVWHLNKKVLVHFDQMFLKSDWKVRIPEPDYTTTNIFAYFAAIPATIRAKFMQENSRLVVGAMVQGTVCIGSTATYAIADHFWGWFLKPEMDPSVQNPTLGLNNADILNTNPIPWEPKNFAEREFVKLVSVLDLTALNSALKLIKGFRKLAEWTGLESATDEDEGLLAEMVVHLRQNHVRLEAIIGAIHHFLRTTHANHVYQEAWETGLRKLLKQKGKTGLSLDDIWTGDGDALNYPKNDNPNAWLNITRHERNTSVQFGPEGGFPQSIWVVSYSNFERLYYNLVAEYKAWGDLVHKMATWRHMSYVRLEGEDLAVSLLPREQRDEIRAWFTRGLGAVANKLFFPLYSEKALGEYPPREAQDLQLKGATAEKTVDNMVVEETNRLSAVAQKASSLVHSDLASEDQKELGEKTHRARLS